MSGRFAACILAGALAWVGAGGPRVADAADEPTTKALLALAADYVSGFVQRFSNVVAEEAYVQDWKTSSGIRLLHRELLSDFLLTRTSPDAPWQAFRDVVAVNGTPLRDRDDRLTQLFVNASPDAIKQATAIAIEGARYNISNVQRTVNQPLFVFIFLQRDNQSRFSFSVDRQDRSAGENIWIVKYKESARPTMIRGTGDRDLPAEGRVWMDSVTGRVVRTEMKLEDKLQSSEISARFAPDEQFAIDVPIEMDEQYSVKGNAGKITGKATYSRFRRFAVKTQEQFKPPSDPGRTTDVP